MGYRAQEEDGIFAIAYHPEAFSLTALGLHAQQHRGKDTTTIISSDGQKMHLLKLQSQASDILTKGIQFPGTAAIGQIRFARESSTTALPNTPSSIYCRKGNIAVAFSGSVDIEKSKKKLLGQGAVFEIGNDVEIILHLIARHPADSIVESVQEVIGSLSGAFSMLLLSDQFLIAARDRLGFRPLSLAIKTDGSGLQSLVYASETCAFDLIFDPQDQVCREEVNPGEIVLFEQPGTMRRSQFGHSLTSAFCARELIYLAKPDSVVFGNSVTAFREKIGGLLAKHHPLQADLVCGMPDYGTEIAIGYSSASKIPHQKALIRNHYSIPRDPPNLLWEKRHSMRINPNEHLVKGKRIILIVNEILQGRSSKIVIEKLRQKGATAIYVLVGSPPTISHCEWGVDLPPKESLLCVSRSVDEIRQHIEADYLGFLSLDQVREALGITSGLYCTSCFTGIRPPLIQLRG